MNLENVKQLLESAKKEEVKNPKHAAKHYLEAADLLLKGSPKDKEQVYFELASKSYKKARELNESANPQKEQKPKTPDEITLKDIGGLESLKEQIRLMMIEPLKNPKLFEYYKKSIGGGILMYGPPGCGKTLIARAAANEAGVNFMHVKGSDLKGRYYGDTEQKIADLFAEARENQPTIIFFDEFENLGGDRNRGTAPERSTVAQLLAEMDGLDSKDQQILFLAATNTPWAIDSAFRREGRFGRTLFIPQPDYEARRQIIDMHMAGRPTTKLDIHELADMTGGFSGADLKALCEQATDIPLKESIKTGMTRNIAMKDMKSALSDIESVLPQWFSQAIHQLKRSHLTDTFKDLVVAAPKVKVEQEAGA